MKKFTHIIDFKGRKYSGFVDLNYLSTDNNIYIMDNHKAALWCWLQCIDLSSKYRVLHIDRHTDCLGSRMGKWISALDKVDICKLSIQDYEELRFSTCYEEFAIFRWDNYLSIFVSKYNYVVEHVVMATDELGDQIQFPNYQIVENRDDLPQVLKDLDKEEANWIINFDIDYFLVTQDGENYTNVNLEYVKEIGMLIKRLLDNGLVSVLTIALSPECSINWENSIKLLNIFLNELGYIVDDI